MQHAAGPRQIRRGLRIPDESVCERESVSGPSRGMTSWEVGMATQRRWRLIPAVWGLSAVLGATAAAAQPATSDRLTVAFGVGVADPFHADFEFTAFTWAAAVRKGVFRHLAIEGRVTDWTHTSNVLLLNQPLSGPTGILGSVGRITARTRRDSWSMGVNALATGTTGRLTLSAGGGGGVMLVHRRFTQTGEECTAAVLQACETFVSTFGSASMLVQGVGGADLTLTRRLRAFGEFRLAFPLSDPGSGDASLVAGMRFVVRQVRPTPAAT